jgi:hypothetical protein
MKLKVESKTFHELVRHPAWSNVPLLYAQVESALNELSLGCYTDALYVSSFVEVLGFFQGFKRFVYHPAQLPRPAVCFSTVVLLCDDVSYAHAKGILASCTAHATIAFVSRKALTQFSQGELT